MNEDSKAAFHAKRLPADAWVHTSPDELRKYQTEHGVSQSGLARHLHANSDSLKQWLDGTKIPSLVMQARFKEALGNKPEATPARSKQARSKPKASPAATAAATRPKPVEASTSAARPKPSASTSAARPKPSASTKATRPKPSASTKATRPKPAASTKATRPKKTSPTSAARPKKKSASSGARRGGRKPGTWVHLQKDQVAQYRKDAKLSRAKLAELLGVSPTSIQNWEVGKSIPMNRYQQRLVEIIKGGAAAAIEAAPATKTKGRPPKTAKRGSTTTPATSSANAGPLELQVTRLSVTGEILKGYLSTAQGSKVSPDQLVSLARALQGAEGLAGLTCLAYHRVRDHLTAPASATTSAGNSPSGL